MYNSNNFILMISIFKLKNIIDKNFNFIEIKNQHLIKIQLKENNETPFLENNEPFSDNEDEHFSENTDPYDTNFFLNSFINVIDSFQFDIEDWQLIYKKT
jgi:hypothetical protein